MSNRLAAVPSDVIFVFPQRLDFVEMGLFKSDLVD